MTSQMLATPRQRDDRGGEPVDTVVDPVNRRLRAVVEGAAATLDDNTGPGLETHVLRERVRLLDRLRGIASTGLADTVRALQRAGTIADDGASSTAEWLKEATGRSGRDAARVARLATDLADLPATRAALAAGDLTDEAADAVVGAARDGRLGPPAEVDAQLASVATTSSPEDLRADIRARQQAADGAAMLRDERRQHARRSFRLVRQDTGMWRPSGDLPDELGQALRTALDAFDHPDGDVLPQHRRRPEQRLCDALTGLVTTALDRALVPATGGIARPHLSVIVDASTVSADLSDPTADASTAAPPPDDARWAALPAGQLPWGGRLSPQAVRRICCDAAVSRIVMAGPSQVLDVGRVTRQWSEPQRRAVNTRDRTCRGPNCSRPVAWTSIHHIRWWQRDRGPTDIDNGLALCHHCHRLVHDHGWSVDLDPTSAAATWTSPTGAVRTTLPPGARADDPPLRPPETPVHCHDGATQPESTTTSGGPPRR